MLKKVPWPLFAILFSLQISGCSPTPPDVPACEDLGQKLSTDPVSGHVIMTPSPTCMAQIGESSCGHCVFIMTGRETFIGEGPAHLMHLKKWSELKAQSVYLPAVESYAPLSAYIINSCKKMGCNDQVDKFRVKLNSLNGIGAVVRGP